MRKVNLFIAMSLDGYIADSQGGVDWLGEQGEESEDVDSYSAFIKDIDTVLMGWKTYHQIVTELSPGEWIYNHLKTYVFTHKEQKSTEHIQFVNGDPADLITALREAEGKDIWICGGANFVQQMVKEDLIDCYYITIIPTILGAGIRLFSNLAGEERKLKLVDTQTYNGMTDLVYVRR
ncbi:MAG: dihydrofolate reductase [Lachnospiraceae bacterium]|nr:dihydrofolate reductase [Lachnospiraceae bacterium]